MNYTDFQDFLLRSTGAAAFQKQSVIQTLWSGYGTIARYQLEKSDYNTVIVKSITLDRQVAHPRGWNSNTSHLRKVRSYEVETHWYQSWSKACPSSSKIPHFIASWKLQTQQWIVLEDLDVDFPLRKHAVSLQDVRNCLQWLAHFHGHFLGYRPEGLWEIGSYWHLATRRDEWSKIENARLKSQAEAIDQRLNSCSYQTIIHGDAKVANFCFSASKSSVAAVDFQYVGGGCGMKDVIYLLRSCLSSSDCARHASALLDYYFAELTLQVNQKHPRVDVLALEQEWRDLYAIAWTDFTRFLMGWMPTHQKINAYSLQLMDLAFEQLGIFKNKLPSN